MMLNTFRVRKTKNIVAITLMGVTATLACIPIFLILFKCLELGLPAMTLQFFTELPKPAGESGGGLAHSILGTLTIVTLTTIASVPVAVILGLLTSEFPKRKTARLASLSLDVLSAIPSILIGVFIYEFAVVAMGGFSMLAGVAALALIFIPIMAKSSHEIFSLVPREIRESGMALGLSRSRVLVSILLIGVRGGLLRSALLCIARVSGESAPLLFTALNANYFGTSLFRPVSTLPVQIYTFAQTPFPAWQEAAWAGALVLIGISLSIQVMVRVVGSKV